MHAPSMHESQRSKNASIKKDHIHISMKSYEHSNLKMLLNFVGKIKLKKKNPFHDTNGP